MSADDVVSNPNDVPDASRNDSTAEQDAHARKANADSLRRQIQILKEGRSPRSLNEFVEQPIAMDV